MISFQNGVFALHGDGFSYLFRATKHGQLEHLQLLDWDIRKQYTLQAAGRAVRRLGEAYCPCGSESQRMCGYGNAGG